MSSAVRITVLVENTAHGRGLLGEHGLSFWIECCGRHVLFDTGQSDLFAHNAGVLGVDLSLADAIVLSHGHYDHTGGLDAAMRAAPRARVYMHPDVLRPKFTRQADGTGRSIGLPHLSEQDIRDRCSALEFTVGPTEIAPGLFVTGPIPRTTLEDVGGNFFLDAGCTQPDPLIDDQALYYTTARGVVVVLGCAHAGVINTIQYIRKLTGQDKIRAIIGGMHLLNASKARLAFTVESLQEYEDQILAPAHCTGTQQTMLLWYRYPKRCQACNVGSRFKFD